MPESGREARARLPAAGAEARRARLRAICTSLPEVAVEGDVHLAYRVRRRSFIYDMWDHHGDGRHALCAKVPAGDQEALIEMDPDRFFRPAYLGASGWVGLRLDLAQVDWEEAERLVRCSYGLVAPRRLAAGAGIR
ncbi:MAG: MmcQ/YjbR family DNA-binding protein [Candidatus Dormibacteraeota bacterium]|nr:MmcQ/YjbR family DNA-binding protein [Candidatus Dormibacteraeota bacterium]